MRGRRIALELHCTVTLYAGLKEWILGDEAGCPERHQVRGSGCGVGLDQERECVYVRRQGKHTRVYLLSAFLRAKRGGGGVDKALSSR